MFRKVTLTTVNIVSHFAIAQMIHKQIQKLRPDIYVQMSNEHYSKQELVKHYAKLLGLTVAVALIASAAAGIAVNAVDSVAFPNQSGPF